MKRSDLKGRIQTVLGLIEPGQLGRTLMHEHVLCDIRPPGIRSENDLGPEITIENTWQINYGRGIRSGRKYMLDLEDIALREVEMMKHSGGDAIVELTCGGLSPDPAGLKRIAEGTGVHLVMGCGHYVNDYQDPRNHGRQVDDFANRDDRPDPGRRMGHRRARRHDRRDRLPVAVDRYREARDAGSLHRRARDRRLDQRPSRPRSRPAAGSGRFRQGRRLPDRAHGHQPHRPHHLRRTASPEARRLRRHGRVRPVRPGVRAITASPTSTCRTTRRGSG